VKVHRTLRSPSRAAVLVVVVAAALGGGLALGGAAALGKLGETKVVEAMPSPALEPVAFQHARALTINQVYRSAAPGVVHITATSQTADVFGNAQQQQSIGSGFVIDKAGHIVTNYHVVQGAKTVQVSFSNHESMAAKIVGSDPATDIAVLKVSAPSRALRPLTLGNSSTVEVGDQVIAIGNPLGYDRSVTSGIVSAVQRSITAPNQVSTIGHVIQTDAALNHGNSGGPLLNADGDVIGVNAQIAPSDANANIGIGFAIPINTVKQVTSTLIDHGKVEHAFLGIEAKAIDAQIAQIFHLPVDSGLLLARVIKGTGAARSGLRAGSTEVVVEGESWPAGGDLLVKADGHPLTTVDDLRNVIADKKPGSSLKLELYRGVKQLTVSVKLGRQPASPP
jgi:S1-C subfamily serine protease